MIADLSRALGEAMSGPVLEDDIVLLQEVPRGEVGWQRHTYEKLKLFTHRDENTWRGVGPDWDLGKGLDCHETSSI